MKKGGGGTQAAGQAGQAPIDCRSRRLRQVPRRFHPGRHHPVRLGLGLARASRTASSTSSKTPNGENPLVHGATPILGVDVWEHSYYIDYRNARPKYLEAFVDSLINWDYVLEMYESAMAHG